MEKLPAGFAYGPGASTPVPPGSSSNVASGTAVKNSYLTWHQSFEYKFDAHYVFIPVKIENQCDVVQQVDNNAIYLIVTGEAERMGEEPVLELFPYDDFVSAESTDKITDGDQPKIVLLKADFVTHEPSPNGRYRITWKQIYKFHSIGQSLPMKWPYTPLNEELSNKELYAGGIPALPWPAQ